MNERWLLRAVEWARNPPSWKRVRIMLVIVALCLVVMGIEWIWGWPDWLKVNGRVR